MWAKKDKTALMKDKKMKIRELIMEKKTKKYLNVLCRDIEEGRQNR